MHQELSKSPLWRLGNVVRWHEQAAKKGGKEERARHVRIAKDMRKTITSMFFARYQAGEYDETA